MFSFKSSRQVLIFIDEISYDVFKFSIYKVYFHVSQLDDFFLSSVFKIIIEKADTDDLQFDSDHDEDDTVDIQTKVYNNNYLYDILRTLVIFSCKRRFLRFSKILNFSKS